MSDFYQEHYETYHQRTFSIDPSIFLNPFIKRLSIGSRILDIGCGSGRDLCWLRKKGFTVTGFERSAGLAAIARAESDCKVIEGDFETYDFSTLSVDAVLLCGSLVHVPHKRLPHILTRTCRSMKVRRKKTTGCESVDGSRHYLIYLSLKKGEGCYTAPDGRRFYLWENRRLRNFFQSAGFKITDFYQSDSVFGNGDVWLTYCLRPPSMEL